VSNKKQRWVSFPDLFIKSCQRGIVRSSLRNVRIVNLPSVKCAREPPTTDVKNDLCKSIYSLLGPSSFLGCSPALWHVFFQVSTSRHARSNSPFNLSLLALSSAMACSVNSFSRVHFSMFWASFSLSCVMKDTARCKIDPLFFSHPGTIFDNSLMPSLIVSRRRRST
jgi:hypothetical protein